jgi:hypothetical protein
MQAVYPDSIRVIRILLFILSLYLELSSPSLLDIHEIYNTLLRITVSPLCCRIPEVIPSVF